LREAPEKAVGLDRRAGKRGFFALRLVVGDFAGALLGSQRAVPAKLEEALADLTA
jgi:hypothetical protein